MKSTFIQNTTGLASSEKLYTIAKLISAYGFHHSINNKLL